MAKNSPAGAADELGEQAGGERADDEADDEVDDEDEGEPTAEELFELILEAVEHAVACLLRWPDPDSACDVACELREEVTELDCEWEAPGPISASGVLAYCLTGPRDEGIGMEPAIGWVAEHLGPEAGADAERLGRAVASAVGPASSGFGAAVRSGLSSGLSDDVVTAMFWLATGLAATAGRGDAEWLRQYVPYFES